MEENNPYAINENSEQRFYNGWINWSFRQYAYFQEGLNHTSQMRTIAYFLIGVGLVFKIPEDQYLVLGLIGLATIPPLWIFGYIMKIRGNRSLEYFNIRDLSPYGKYGVQLQEKQMKNLDEINLNIKLLLEEIKKNNSG